MDATPLVAAEPATEHTETRPALLSFITLYVVTTVHHLYGGLVLDAPVRLLVPLLLALPLAGGAAALEWFRRTGRRGAARTYAGIALVVAGVLGLVHSAYSHLYKDVLFLLRGPAELYVLLNPDEHYPPDDLFFEVTGVIELVAAVVVTVTAIRLLRAASRSAAPPA
ncbi:hypothetical protein GCM10009819_29930 [Agromyces tropicus]|uniref:Lycopene cyclase domain-containing protein n=1 Tax=Agromyces tropicus TaxID=555371 RepID=A0ABP5G7Z9_9MICO